MSDRNEYDSPWKMILDTHLEDALRLYFPDIAEAVDWDKPVRSLEQELQRIAVESEVEKKHVDKLIEVSLLDGEAVWLLIHIEVQRQPETDFAQRMFVYHYRIYERYGRHPISTAILTDGSRSWRPSQYRHAQFGSELTLDFRVAKLLDYDEAILAASTNPFALVTLAQIWETQAGKSSPARYDAKLGLLRLLSDAGYGKDKIRNLFRFIDWILQLPAVLSEQLRVELERKVPKEKLMYVTSFERMAEAKGVEQGIEQGIEQSIILLIGDLFDDVPEALEEAIIAIDDKTILVNILLGVPRAESLADVWALLPTDEEA